MRLSLVSAQSRNLFWHHRTCASRGHCTYPSSLWLKLGISPGRWDWTCKKISQKHPRKLKKKLQNAERINFVPIPHITRSRWQCQRRFLVAMRRRCMTAKGQSLFALPFSFIATFLHIFTVLTVIYFTNHYSDLHFCLRQESTVPILRSWVDFLDCTLLRSWVDLISLVSFDHLDRWKSQDKFQTITKICRRNNKSQTTINMAARA